MMRCSWIQLIAAGIVFFACMTGTAAATTLGVDWSERPAADSSPFSGVQISADGNTVFAGGYQMLLRNWEGNSRYGGRPGFIAAMSPEGNYVVTALDRTVTLINRKGELLWDRVMPSTVRAVAITRDGTMIASADENGNYNSWAKNGEFYGRNTDDKAKRLAISRDGSLIVATTEGGLRFFDGAMNLKWADNKSGSIDTYIAISSDGSTVLTAGGNRLSSHTSAGKLNWMNDVTKEAIIDMAAAEDGSAIFLAGQDSAVTAVDRDGRTHWTYPTNNKWANAIGVSKDASVIGVGANDGTLYVLDHGGTLLAKKNLGGIIQPRSLAVSRDGTRIAVSDQYHLSGISVLGDMEPEGMVTFTVTPMNPARWNTKETPIPTTLPVVTALTQEEIPPPTPVPTQKSPAGLHWAAISIIAGGFLFVTMNRRR